MLIEEGAVRKDPYRGDDSFPGQLQDSAAYPFRIPIIIGVHKEENGLGVFRPVMTGNFHGGLSQGAYWNSLSTLSTCIGHVIALPFGSFLPCQKLSVLPGRK